MSNVNLEMAQDMDKAAAAEDQAVGEVKSIQQQELMQSSGLATNGPAPDKYNYGAVDVTPDPDGGFNLPMRGHDVNLAGRNLQTGEVVQKRYDPDGLGEEGVKRFGDSYTNTVNGEPSDIYEATVPLMIEHMQNGGTVDDFPAPISPEAKARTGEAVQGLGKLALVESKLRATEYEEIPDQLEQAESITRDQYAENPAVQAATQVLAEYIQPGLFAGNPGEQEKLIEKSIEELSAVKASFWKMADIIIDVETGQMPDEVRDAYITLLTEHAKIPDMDADVWQGVGTGMIADLPFMAATGGLSAVMLKTIGKQAAVRLLLSKLMTSTTKKAVGTGMAIGGTTGGMEEGMLGGGEELMNQNLSGEDRDWEKVFDRTWTGAGWGTVMGMGFGAVLSKPGIDGVRYMMRNASDMLSEAGVRTDMAAQRGSIGIVSDSDTPYNGMTVPESRSDIGVRFADSSMDEFYSRLQETLIGEGQPLIGKKQPGESRHKAADLLKTLEKVSGNKFGGHELKESGLKSWLASQGDGTVSRDMVEDYLYANSPRTNILVSSMTDYQSPGTLSYKGEQEVMAGLRRNASLEVFQDRFFDVKEVRQPVDMTQANASSKTFAAEMDHRITLQEKAAHMDAEGLSYPEDVPLMSTKPQLAAVDYPNAEGHTQVLWQWADRKQKAYAAGKPFSEEVPMPEPRNEMVYQITDLRDGATHVAPDEFSKYRHLKAAAEESTANMTNDQIVEMIDVHDQAKLLAPPKYGQYTLTGEAGNGYQEVRIILPYDGVTNPDTIAMERFGSSYDDLTHGNKTRVDRTMEYANAPTENYTNALHMPLENNRLSTIRTQEFYTPDQNRILAVNELQSDMAVAMRDIEKKGKPGYVEPPEDLDADDAAQAFFDEADNTGGQKSKVDPSLQKTDGWMEQSLNRIMQLAEKQGYNQVAFPVDPAMIKQIQGWTDEMADMKQAKSTVRFYESLGKLIKKLGKPNMQLGKTWGISSIEMGHVGSTPTGSYAPEKMLIIKFDASKHKGPKPLYGVAAISGAEGATMMDEEND